MQSPKKRNIGVIGYGNLGQFLVEKILQDESLDLAFVWNRNLEAVRGKVDDRFILENLDDIHLRDVDLVVEVAHSDITEKYGESILEFSDYMIGSPTALSNPETERRLRRAATRHSLYIPSGALWGADDINKMADMGTVQRLKVTMTFHPDSLKLNSPLKELNSAVTQRTILYEGNVRDLCPLAPHNVNTMAAASLAAHNLGMDKVEGCLISDPSAADYHVIEVEVWGKPDPDTGNTFYVRTSRQNPALVGRVTGSQTVLALFSSLLRAQNKCPGFHFC